MESDPLIVVVSTFFSMCAKRKQIYS